MAERVGFEPTVRFPPHTLSKRAPSATRTPLRWKLSFWLTESARLIDRRVRGVNAASGEYPTSSPVRTRLPDSLLRSIKTQSSLRRGSHAVGQDGQPPSPATRRPA